MPSWLLIAVTGAYFWTALALVRTDWALGGVFFGYAVANVFFIIKLGQGHAC